ncbi:hypothetical protein BDN72DRAFT_890439 [Pluteus cervinus]|uniref:Uncharacterized protein n=1 Tax=Pluteus cervinus TaxID=181527 RepID=A0ACD3BEZ3_9AGAR|nr:hypothetical protein BDN72DRAFT_890439 [Pluteus cervinus]
MSAVRSLVSYDDITLPFEQTPSSLPPRSNKKRKTSKQKGSNNLRLEQRKNSTGASRELTHEEIWDDRALVEAWDAAAEEYETLNGPEKDWKNEPVSKSPLWYSVPGKADAPPVADLADSDEDARDSQPLDFSSFIPTHNPSLKLSDASTSFADERTPVTAQDEAFRRALDAMYWAGYWTAVYHHTNSKSDPHIEAGDDNEPVNGSVLAQH